LVQLDPAVLRPIPTGFPQLDTNTGGGLHTHDLVLVVGKQNVGKTLFVSWLGRTIACGAARMRNKVVCVLISYERSLVLLLERLLCIESWLAADPEDGVALAELRVALADLAKTGEPQNVSSLLLRLPEPGLLAGYLPPVGGGGPRDLERRGLCRGGDGPAGSTTAASPERPLGQDGYRPSPRGTTAAHLVALHVRCIGQPQSDQAPRHQKRLWPMRSEADVPNLLCRAAAG
jgi:hypothetical protein